MALLEVFKGGRQNLPESFALMKIRTTIGRAENCDVRLTWDGMSRIHSEIVGHGGDAYFVTPGAGKIYTSFEIRDCGGGNGTYVNNVRVSRSILRDGDTISFGKGAELLEGEVIPERHLQYIFVFKLLKLRGEVARERNQAGAEPGARSSSKPFGNILGDRGVAGGGEDGPPPEIHPPCRSHLYAPSSWHPRLINNSEPPVELQLDYVHGYRCAVQVMESFNVIQPGRADNLHNVYLLDRDRLMYPAACLVVVMDVYGTAQRFYRGHDDDVICLARHPGGAMAASGQVASFTNKSPPIHVWDVESLQVVAVLRGFHARRVSLLDFSPTGQFLVSVGGDDKHSVAVYDWQAGSKVFSGTGHVDDVFCVRHNPKNLDQFCQVGNKHVRFWSFEDQDARMATLKQAKPPPGTRHPEPQVVACCAFMDSGECAVGLAEGHVLWYDEVKGGSMEVVGRIERAHEGAVLCLCGASVGLITGGSDGTVKVWGLESGGPGSGSGSGSRVAGSAGRGARGSKSWKDGVRLKKKVDVKGMVAEGLRVEAAVTSVHYMGGRVAVGTSAGMIAVIETRTDPAPAAAAARGAGSQGRSQSRAASASAGAGSRSARGGRESANGVEGAAARGGVWVATMAHFKGVNGCAVSPTGQSHYVTVSDDATLRVWSLAGRQLLQCVHLGVKATAVAISPDESIFAVGQRRGQFTLWDVPSRPQQPPRCLLKNTQRFEDITDIKFSPDGRYIAAACREQVVDIYDCAADFRKVGQALGHTGAVLHVDFSADGKLLRSTCTACELLYWEVPSGRLLGRSSQMRDVAWASNSVVFDWGLSGVWPPGAKGGDIDAATVSHDRSYCITGDDSGAIRLFNYPAVGDHRHWERCKEYQASSSHLHKVEFTQDDQWVVTTGGDAVVMQWKVVPRESGNFSRAPVMQFHRDGGVEVRDVTRPKREGGFTNPYSRKS